MRRFGLSRFTVASPIFAGILLLNASCRPEVMPAPSSVATGSTWEGKLVRKPGESPEDSKVFVVKDGKKHWVVSADWLQPHGFKWPDDVHTIRAEDLEAIPQGEPVQ